MLFYEGDIASIYDKETNTRHEFNLYTSKNGKFEASYLRSCDETDKYKKLVDINKDNWDFRVNQINDSIFELSEYKRKKAKKPTRRTVIKIKESSENHINLLHKIDDRLLNLLMAKLDKSKNYTIFEMSFYFNENKGKDIKLIDFQKLNYEVILPENLNFKESCETHFFH